MVKSKLLEQPHLFIPKDRHISERASWGMNRYIYNYQPYTTKELILLKKLKSFIKKKQKLQIFDFFRKTLDEMQK